MITLRTLAFTFVATVALCACGKSNDTSAPDAAKPAHSNLADLATPARQEQMADKALPTGDVSRPLPDYRSVDSGNQMMFIFYGLSNLPVDYDMIAQAYSTDYQQTSDSFRKNDLLNALKPRIDAAIKTARENRYIVTTTPNVPLSAYDFTKKGFVLTGLAPDSYQYFFDNSRYAFEFSNVASAGFLKVDDEAKAREIEDMRSHFKPMTLRIYAFAQEADPSTNRVKFDIVHMQLVDQVGRVMYER